MKDKGLAFVLLLAAILIFSGHVVGAIFDDSPVDNSPVTWPEVADHLVSQLVFLVGATAITVLMLGGRRGR